MTDARVTQESLELWTQTTAAAQVTVIVSEEWGTIVSSARLALVTMMAIEEWARVPPVVPRGGQTIVTVNTG